MLARRNSTLDQRESSPAERHARAFVAPGCRLRDTSVNLEISLRDPKHLTVYSDNQAIMGYRKFDGDASNLLHEMSEATGLVLLKKKGCGHLLTPATVITHLAFACLSKP